MSVPTPDPASNPIVAAAPTAEAIPAVATESVATGNLPLAIVGGAVASVIGAVLWAVITVVTEYQIGFMAIGVGFLVGAAVAKLGNGDSTAFRIVGAAFALFGCVLGNFFTLVGFAAREADTGVFAMFGQLNWGAIPGVMASTASPMDFLFYAIAVYEGYKLSVKR